MSSKDDKMFVVIFVIWIIGILISLSLTGFTVWVVIKLMTHFGVI